MMEAMMGPAAGFGPGTTSGGSCDFRCAYETDVMIRLGVEEGLKTETVNLATAKSELGRVDPISIYKLITAKKTYRHKLSSDIVTEMTLVSPDSNFEAIGVWTG